MGAGKFGPPGWHQDPEWKGWWGANPPFHTPTFILTHHPRPPIEMEGGTTFHFVEASPAEALETARKAAGGEDVRLGGGASMIRDFFAAGLVDYLHIGHRGGLRNRGRLIAQRSHASDVHPWRCLNGLRSGPSHAGLHSYP
jgi:dihydrofolate reductase